MGGIGRTRAIVGAARSGERGITLIELLVAMIIGVMLIVVAAVSLRGLDTVNTRTGARFLSATLRFGFDRARVTGRDHRMVFDLDAEGGTTVTFEIASEGKQLLPRTLDEAWAQHEDLAEGGEEKRRQEAMESTTIGGLSKDLLTLPRPTGPRWQKVALRTRRANEQLAKSAKLVKSIYVARLDEEIHEGKVALHIWGGGRLERAALYVSRDKDKVYTLVTYPLTGRVKIHGERVSLSGDLVGHDDLGEVIEER